MLFKFLEKPIEITASVKPDYAFANTFSPIEKSSKFIPKWWRKTPKSSLTISEDNKITALLTTKNCPGIIGTFQNGYIVPLWSDLLMRIENDRWIYQFSDGISSIQDHSNNQMVDFHPNYHILKISTPWTISASTNINLIFLDPFYHFPKERNYYVPYGISPLIDKNFKINCFMFVKKEKKEMFMPQGTPLLHIIPITEKEIKFKTEVITQEQYLIKQSIVGTSTSFVSNGLNRLRILRKQKNG